MVREESASLKFKEGYVMQLPPILQGESLTRLAQGAAVGFALTVAFGFNWFGYGLGWTLGSTAEKMANSQTDKALISALAPVCAEKFAALPDAATKRAALLKADSWKRDEFMPKTLITLPGEPSQTSGLLEACFELIKAPKTSNGAQAQKG